MEKKVFFKVRLHFVKILFTEGKCDILNGVQFDMLKQLASARYVCCCKRVACGSEPQVAELN